MKPISAKEISRRLAKDWTFKFDDREYRKTYSIYLRGQLHSYGIRTKARCKQDIKWMVSWQTKETLKHISLIRRLGFKVTRRA